MSLLNGTMTPIETVEVTQSGGQSAIQFNNIPNTYTDLVVLLSTRTTRTSAEFEGVAISFNGSTSNFTGRYVGGHGVDVATSTSPRYIGWMPSNTATSFSFSNIELYIPNYAGNSYKCFMSDARNEYNSATVVGQYAIVGLWSNTDAINSITFTGVDGINNFTQHSTATLYGVTSAAVGAKATGGIISFDANYWYHTFLASGTFTPTSNITADYLVVAGGGGGGSANTNAVSAGGGAGGLRCTVGATGGGGSLPSALSLTASANYTITIGAGGNGATTSAPATNGSNSSISGTGISTVTSTGGGNGGTQPGFLSPDSLPSIGGSGGGAAWGWSIPSAGSTGAAGTANEGYAGGSVTTGGSANSSAGGGGAGAVGSNNGSSGSVGGNGGNGVTTTISGTSITYAGGGGGSAYGSGSTAGTGGTGGGGNASSSEVTTAAGNGTANTGGGGGGAANRNGATGLSQKNGGAGGSGIVIIRYAK